MFYSSKEGNDGEIIYSQAHSNFIKIVSHLKFVLKSCILLLLEVEDNIFKDLCLEVQFFLLDSEVESHKV